MRMSGSPDQRRLPAWAHPKMTNRHAVRLLNKDFLIDSFGPSAGRVYRIKTGPGLQSGQLDRSRSRKQAIEIEKTRWAPERAWPRRWNHERPGAGEPGDDSGILQR